MTLPNFSLDGKVALVTGGRSGIGRAIALAFAKAGADVVVCGRTPPDLEKVAGEIRTLGRRSLAIQTDVSRKSEVDNLVHRAVDEMGAIDILVNNAGISGEVNLFETPEDEWDRVIDVNLKGCYLCAQAVGKGMIERKKGNIISIASTDGISAELIRRPYNVSKAGIIMLTRVLARQLASYGIRVNAIAPGWIKTEMIRPLWDYPERLKQVEAQIPMGRIGEPEEIAGVALFLASEASSYITGHTIVADGGSLA